MTSEDASRKKASRKLTKRRADRHVSPLQMPDRFRDGADAQDDVTAPKGKMAHYMNQSVFSMIAAAGSKTDFHARFDESSSDSDEGPDSAPGRLDDERAASGNDSAPEDPRPARQASRTEQARSSSRRLLRSMPRLRLRTHSDRSVSAQSSRTSSPKPPSDTQSSPSFTPLAPVMSRMLEAEAQLHSEPSGEGSLSPHDGAASPATRGSATTLAKRLMEIFDFDEPEHVISEYPCWLLKSVLLQGYMYITAKHICFYAYLPKKSNVIVKSGYLSKRGRQNPKFNRYWFTLKGDVLAYYADPSNLYFPSGNIDLRYGISAALAESKDKAKPSSSFAVTTHQRVYSFKADSAASAKEWVRTLQKVIFRSHNDGDSVKVSLPLENIIDVDDSPVLDFAETFKIRVVDNDETYAIDEYFFSFFSFGKEALRILRSLVDDTPAQQIHTDLLLPGLGQDGTSSPRESAPGDHLRGRQSLDQGFRSSGGPNTPVLHDTVRATLSPLSPGSSAKASPRTSFDVGRTASFDHHRRSMDLNRDFPRPSFDRSRSASHARKSLGRERWEEKAAIKSPRPTHPQGSSDSFVHSLDREAESTDALNSSDGTQASASQILNRSDVFQSPTIPRLAQLSPAAKPPADAEAERRRSEESSPSAPAETDIRLQPSTRSQTLQSASKPPSHRVELVRRPHKSDAISSTHEAASSTPTLQELVKAGAYPLQRAAGFAGYLKNRSKRMSNLLATESMGYIEKVSGMWTGARRHYDDPPGLSPDEPIDEPEEDEDANEVDHGDRFRAHFTLQPSEKLQATYFGYLHRVLPLYGKIYISNRSFCFRSLLPGTRTKMILPLKDIENVDKEKGFRFGYSGLVIVIRGHEELFFEFGQADTRDDCAVTLLQNLEAVRYLQESGILTQEEKASVDAAKAEHRMLQEARQVGHNEHDLKLPRTAEEAPMEAPPILFDDPRASIINFKPTESLRVTCLTIGSRGDVQPYIALCKGLLAEGHRPRIATHAEFEPWVRKHGIDFAPVDGDPAELMRICVENGMFTYSFIREASLKFRGWIDELLSSAWKACQDSDLLIESPSAMAGIHIAEALRIPYFRAFTMPWTRTRAYPHAFAVPEHKMGGAYNYFTYVMFDNVFWKAIAGQVNRWRKKELGLPRTNLDKMQPNKVPFLYNFSPSVVVPPIDYSDWIRVTGYWFLDEATGWEPPKELADFIRRARSDKKKIVYVGFGSIVVSDPAALTKTIIESVLKADVRCILSKGWSDRLGNKDATEPEMALPSEILQIKSAPHDWLFRHIDAAAHHGGAGTTGASLRAGLPTIVKPFFGDQFFFGSRVEDLGVGLCVKKLNVTVFSRALWECTHSERMIVKAKVLGEEIRQEDGVANAIQALYRDMEYAKTLIKKHVALVGAAGAGSVADDGISGGPNEFAEESWTFIGDDSDPELVRRIAEWEPMVRHAELRKGHGNGQGTGDGQGRGREAVHKRHEKRRVYEEVNREGEDDEGDDAAALPDQVKEKASASTSACAKGKAPLQSASETLGEKQGASEPEKIGAAGTGSRVAGSGVGAGGRVAQEIELVSPVS